MYILKNHIRTLDKVFMLSCNFNKTYSDYYRYFSNEGYLIFLSLILIVVTPLDYILYIRWLDGMINYKWFASSFIFPLFGIVFFYAGVLCKNLLSKPVVKCSQKPLVVMGVMDGIRSLLQSFSAPYLSIIVMTILDKLSLPILMAFSYCMLNRRYYKSHYLGVFLTVYAVMVSYIPSFSDGKFNEGWATTIFVISILPGVLSFVFKEKMLDDQEVDIWWMNLWISVWQFIFGIFMFPIMLLPLSGSDLTIKVSDVGSYFRDAFKCQFAGINSRPGDHCESNLFYLIIYNVISTFINVLMFMMIKEGSATYYMIINTVKLPIQAWLGSFKSIAGSNYSPININNLFSFVLLAVSTMVYNNKKEISYKRISSTDSEVELRTSDDKDESDVDYRGLN
tara:strand:+ start:3858 stop:5039 length:1182 start_codon:yes stop_codon:yes gene_type:complete